MPIPATHRHHVQLPCFMLFALMLSAAQVNPDESVSVGQNVAQSQGQREPAPNSPHGTDYSGMYSFLHEGEFVQITVEDQGRVIGFVSRYADPESKSGFYDHFFTSGKLEGNRLTFATEAVQGVAYDFRGAIDRGDGKARANEGFYVLKGTLTEHDVDKQQKSSSTAYEVALKSFPLDAASPPAARK